MDYGAGEGKRRKRQTWWALLRLDLLQWVPAGIAGWAYTFSNLSAAASVWRHSRGRSRGVEASSRWHVIVHNTLCVSSILTWVCTILVSCGFDDLSPSSMLKRCHLFRRISIRFHRYCLDAQHSHLPSSSTASSMHYWRIRSLSLPIWPPRRTALMQTLPA